MNAYVGTVVKALIGVLLTLMFEWLIKNRSKRRQLQVIVSVWYGGITSASEAGTKVVINKILGLIVNVDNRGSKEVCIPRTGSCYWALSVPAIFKRVFPLPIVYESLSTNPISLKPGERVEFKLDHNSYSAVFLDPKISQLFNVQSKELDFKSLHCLILNTCSGKLVRYKVLKKLLLLWLSKRVKFFVEVDTGEIFKSRYDFFYKKTFFGKASTKDYLENCIF